MDVNYYESRGLAVNRREVNFIARADILRLGGEYQEYKFSHEVFDHYQSRSFARVIAFGDEIKKSEELSDFYGILTCQETPVEWATGWLKKYEGKATIEVVTVISQSLSVFDTRKNKRGGFYNCSFPCMKTPRHWSYQDEPLFDDYLDREYTVWRDGKFTDDNARLLNFIAELAAVDCAGEQRYDPKGQWPKQRQDLISKANPT